MPKPTTKPTPVIVLNEWHYAEKQRRLVWPFVNIHGRYYAEAYPMGMSDVDSRVEVVATSFFGACSDLAAKLGLLDVASTLKP